MNGDASDERSRQMLEQAMARLGANPEQARVMAAQLLKRARQLATERGMTEAQALADLLSKAIAGRQGAYTGKPSGPGAGSP